MAKIELPLEIQSRKFESLCKNKNKLAWGYFGLAEEYTIILSIMKQMITNFDIKIFTKENQWYNEGLNKEDFLKLEEGIEIIEFKTEIDHNPLVEYFGNLCKKIPIIEGNNKGIIITKSKIPNKSLTDNEISKCIDICKKYGFYVEVTENAEKDILNNYSFVAGAEGPEIWHAIKSGKVAGIAKNALGSKMFSKFGGIII
jgi:hypothetical protein